MPSAAALPRTLGKELVSRFPKNIHTKVPYRWVGLRHFSRRQASSAVIEVFTAQTPDVVERGPFAFSVLGSELDVMTIRLSLGYEEDFLNQAVPAQSYTPSNSSGLWP